MLAILHLLGTFVASLFKSRRQLEKLPFGGRHTACGCVMITGSSSFG
jgi:hypothetical protein